VLQVVKWLFIKDLSVEITTETDGNRTTLLVEGRLGVAEAPVLRKECQSVGAPICLDLSGLRAADETGINLLQSLSAAGAELRGASVFILSLLEQARD
jgi:anti-anti-sigma regulatory factor